MSSADELTRPYYDYHVFVCLNEREAGHPRGCCLARDSAALHAYMKDRCKELALAKVRINKSGCLDRCELGPTLVIYPQGVWYHAEKTEDIEEIIQTHLVGGEIVTRLALSPRQKRL